jgi:serine protease Do
MRNEFKALFFEALALAALVLEAAVARPQHSRRDALTEAVAKTRDSVVTIRRQDGKKEDMNSGVVIDDRGFIVTNRHVIGTGNAVVVRLADGTDVPAKVLVSDATSDLAVLRIRTKQRLKALPLAPASDLILAEQVFAIGHPHNYGYTVTRGIISALNREIKLPNGEVLTGAVQTDASINRGNSGGPLVNINGELIGINVAIRSDAHGIAFAINADTVKDVLSRHLSAERVARVSHGIDIRERVVGEVGNRQKVVATGLRQELPAAKAGLQNGDEILAIGRLSVQNRFDVERALWHTQPGEQIGVHVARGGKQITLTLTLAGVTDVGLQYAHPGGRTNQAGMGGNDKATPGAPDP